MKPCPRIFWFTAAGLLVLALSASADPRVSVVAKARPDYTATKYGAPKPRPETYVFMQGSYFDGVTVDHSIARTPFRRIAEYLAPELAKQEYFPITEPAKADLLILVHWGTTQPRVTNQENFGQTSMTTNLEGTNKISTDARENPTGDPGGLPPPPDNDRRPEPNDLPEVADGLLGTMTLGNSVALLGYGEEIYRLSKTSFPSAAEQMLRWDLHQERYFIIMQAFDMHEKPEPGYHSRPLWTVWLNISSPGNNFASALNRMSLAGVNYFGRSTTGVTTVRPGQRQGTVTLAPLTIIGEVTEKDRSRAMDKQMK